MMRSLTALLNALALGGGIAPYPDLTQSRSSIRSKPGGASASGWLIESN